MGGVKLRKISAIHIRKLLFSYPSDNQDCFLIFLHQTCEKNSERSPGESKKTENTKNRSLFDSEVVIGVFLRFTRQPPRRCPKITHVANLRNV